MSIKSFRGKIASGDTEQIALHTNNGTTGYKIKTLQIMPHSWGGVTGEYTVKVHTIPGKTASADIDFSDQTLIAVACQTYNTSANIAGDIPVVVFDNITFNQDIYILAHDNDSSPVNYHIELEVVKLDLNENTVATLKDIRNLS
jgi:hypothetical protein